MLPGIPHPLRRFMQELAVSEDQFQERFLHSSGPGGQNVNKVATCVYLRHLPTGVSVKCQQERSQERNRIRARWLLCQKLSELRESERKAQIAIIEKMRRQKRKRSAAAKEKMLAGKKLKSQRKGLRKRLDPRSAHLW